MGSALVATADLPTREYVKRSLSVKRKKSSTILSVSEGDY